ncbi:MAG: hypothetical protein MUF10_15360, partial [Thermoanaerobaculaceae bacterium]|nr:hypothetical protein [Thermoanaerobaculaceae bacterium]
MRDRFTVVIEEPARLALLGMERKDASQLIEGVRELEYDPFVRAMKDGETSSTAVGFLAKKGYDIRKLKVKDVRKWRIFYYVDTKRLKVLLKEIIARDDRTYELSAPHVQRLIDN